MGAVVVAIGGPAACLADIDPLTGIDFVTITHPANAPWMGDGSLDDRAIGRGSVGYEYRIGRLEVTTAQWTEFFNAAMDRPADDRIPFVSAPTFWGAVQTSPTVSGGQRWRVPTGNELRATGNISWRTAAIYCNWLCNNKSTDRAAFMSGAYDVSTFGYFGNIFTDQQAHTPGAAYYIPSWDEWLKAVHFDPNRFGDDQPGWWTGPGTANVIPAGGPPATGEANWRDFPGWQSVPLGAYPQTRSPWGLLDASGATAEWTESVIQFRPNEPRFRIFDGSYWGVGSSGPLDLISVRGDDFPSIPTYEFGFRIAAFVPSPGTCIPVMAAILWPALSRRRRLGATLLSKMSVGRAVVAPAAAAAVSLSAASASADIDPLTGIDFVTITHPGNAPWMGDGTLDDRAIGRGSVSYEYRIGRLEVTTAQWTEFFNAAFDRPANDRIPFVSAPTFWGGVQTSPTVSGGQRWRVPAGNELRPTGNISWRTAAIYCNWLCNNKSTDRSAFLSGAYDVSTFGYDGIQFTDQLAHTPGAAYYIPSWDEWLKAVHFDPNRFGTDQPGWWTGPLSRDGIPSFGPPATRDSNWGEFPGWQSIPLGAYPRSSPWGLKDTAGATTEWTESYVQSMLTGERWRLFDGSWWGDSTSGIGDLINYVGGEDPSFSTFDHGLRLAASVPAPGSCIPVAAAILWLARTRNRKSCGMM